MCIVQNEKNEKNEKNENENENENEIENEIELTFQIPRQQTDYMDYSPSRTQQTTDRH